MNGTISQATGSFNDVSPGITEAGQVGGSGSQVANAFTLQLNTQFFSGSPACSGAASPANCQAWQQFVYETDGASGVYSTNNMVYMQYWLIDYDATCPSGWYSYSPDCYRNSLASTYSAGPLTAADLASVTFVGRATSGGNDQVSLSAGAGTATLVSNSDSELDLANYWDTTEFDVFGDGGGGEANFGADTTLDAQTALVASSPAAPACTPDTGTTGETNNLTLSGTPALSAEASPTIESAQTNGTPTTASCATAAATPVTVTSPGNQTGLVGAAASLPIHASDNNVAALGYSASGLPPGLSINSSTGLITGTPSSPGTFPVSVTANDVGTSGSTAFSWTIDPVAVTITNPGHQTGRAGTAVSLQIHASDNNGGALGYSASGLPPGLSINSSTGLVTGTPSSSGTFSASVTANDGSASASTAFSWPISRPPAPNASSASLTSIGTGKPKLHFIVSGSTTLPSIDKLVISLPNGLSFAHKKHNLSKGITLTGPNGTRLKGYNLKLSHGKLTITLAAAESKVTVTIKSLALSVTPSLINSVKHHKSGKLKVTVKVTDLSGRVTTLTIKLKQS